MSAMEKSRRMVYPYTFTAKMLQFPFKFYFNNSIHFNCWVYAVVVFIPIMYKIQKLTFSPTLIEKKEKRLQAQHEEYLHHQKHLL